MTALLYTVGVILLAAALLLFAYLARAFAELRRVTSGLLHANLDRFAAEVEPRLRLDRRRAGLAFSLLAHFWLVALALVTALGVFRLVPDMRDAVAELLVLLLVEVLLCMHFIPDLLLARTAGRWVVPLAPLVLFFVWIAWPLRALLEMAVSLAHISEEEAHGGSEAQQEGIEALVEAAQEEGILASDQAQMIEQVVEFSDKRVNEVMTPLPDVVAISAAATVAQLRRLLIDTKFSRIPVYNDNLDDIIGIAFARDLLQVPEDGGQRSVRELVRPALFVPETKFGSALLKEMQRKNQQMAIVVDEHGSVAGLVTIEDLVEEIVGEIGEEDRHPAPDAVREPDGSLVLRGSVSIGKLQELLNVEFDTRVPEAATTAAGLLNHVAGHVPVAGERVDFDGLQFEVLEANQRKVLRLRVRRRAAAQVH